MTSLHLKAPAKVNLALYVLGRRADGYHELWTLMETVSLADELTLRRAPEGEVTLTVSGLPAPAGEENLVLRSASLLRERLGVRAGAEMHLRKAIPAGAGLGGGSSDAAAALVGLNRLWGLRLPEEDLLALGAEIGSDVPFFVAAQCAGGGCAAVCRGRGERVEVIETSGLRWYVLVLPGEGTSTAAVYRALKASSDLTRVPEDAKKIKEALKRGDVSGLRCLCHNDLQGAALALSGACRRAYEEMRAAGLPRVTVSGSGSALYCICESRREAEDYRKKLQEGGRRLGFEVVTAWGGEPTRRAQVR